MSTNSVDDLFDPERLRGLWAPGATSAPPAAGVAATGPDRAPASDVVLLARLEATFERELGPGAAALSPSIERARELFAQLRLGPAAGAAAKKQLPALLDGLEDLFEALELGSRAEA